MSNKPSRKIFVNVSVKDLQRSMSFFKQLGFEFNQQFTDEKAACMIISSEAYVMLLSEPFFETFTKKALCDSSTHTEALLALSCESREEVDKLVRIALESGGKPAMEPVDHGFMYYATFYDPDGHHWEVLWMDPNPVQPAA